MPKFFLVNDVARRLGVTPAAVRLMVQRGRLPIAAMTEGGVRLFDQRTVERFAAERRADRADVVERSL
jgi:DNA-binding transcriptional MerR regulator